MEKVKIKVVKLGKQHHDELFDRLNKYKSNIFSVDIFEKSLSKCDCGWGYTFKTLKELLSNDFDDKKYDMCIGFIDTQIELNYFGKRLSGNNIYVVSFYQVDEILQKDNNDIFNFLLANVYRYVTRYKLNGEYLTHDETRGCLFDMCGNKEDILYSCNNPIICENCLVKMREKGIQSEYISSLRNEIKKIHKPNYYRITDFIKKHPYLSLALVAMSTITLNIASSIIYDLIKDIFKLM